MDVTNITIFILRMVPTTFSVLPMAGGITPANAKTYLDAGASHVIVTSYIFKDGKASAADHDLFENPVAEAWVLLWLRLPIPSSLQLDFDRLQELVTAVGGKEKLVGPRQTNPCMASKVGWAGSDRAGACDVSACEQVLDLSCRKRPEDNGTGPYYVVMNKWQTFTDFAVT